jgi:hypothetical protein
MTWILMGINRRVSPSQLRDALGAALAVPRDSVFVWTRENQGSAEAANNATVIVQAFDDEDPLYPMAIEVMPERNPDREHETQVLKVFVSTLNVEAIGVSEASGVAYLARPHKQPLRIELDERELEQNNRYRPTERSMEQIAHSTAA